MSSGRPSSTELLPDRLRTAKHAYTTRHVDTTAARHLLTSGVPASGDLVLAQVAEIGQHKRLEQRDGRRSTLYPGDQLVVCYGARYAPDQFQATVPGDLGPCELVAAGGLAGRVEMAHEKMDPATTLEPLGLLLDAGHNTLNLRHWVTDHAAPTETDDRPVIVAVVGAAMNSGKTTSASHLVHGLRGAGLRVGAAKVTGTGAGGDVWMLGDAGASPVYDFTSAGVPSTYLLSPAEILGIFTRLTTRLAREGCQVIVVEVADGVYQQETAGLLGDPVFGAAVDTTLFASSDALGASAGVAWLTRRGLPLLALTGVLSSSPLAMAEAVAETGRPVWGPAQLSDVQSAAALYQDLRAARSLPVAGSPLTAPTLEAAAATGLVA